MPSRMLSKGESKSNTALGVQKCMSNGFRKTITYNYDEMYYQWLQLHHPTYAIKSST